MSSRKSPKPSASRSELLAFSLPLTAEDNRVLDDIRYAHPVSFKEYLEFATRWSDAWVRKHGQRGPDQQFDRPFEL